MKSRLIQIIAIALLLCNTNTTFAQGNKEQAKNFLNKTNKILTKAKEAAAKGNVQTSEIIKAVFQQKHARELFKAGKLKKAIHHSNRARTLAREVLKANKSDVTSDLELQKEEQGLIDERQSAKELDAEIKIPKNVDEKSILKEPEEEVR